MRIIYLLLLAALFVFCNVLTSRASHAAGMDLTYQCVGANQYLFAVTFYRDCYGISAPLSMTLQVTNNCTGAVTSYDAGLFSSTQGSDTISAMAGLCPGLQSKCLDPNSPYQG